MKVLSKLKKFPMMIFVIISRMIKIAAFARNENFYRKLFLKINNYKSWLIDFFQTISNVCTA